MRLFELAKKYDQKATDLLKMLQDAGFEVGNTLAAVGDDVKLWLDNHPEELERLGGGTTKPSKQKKALPNKKPAQAEAAPAAVASVPATLSPAPVAASADGGDETEAADDGGKVRKKQKLPAGATRVKVRKLAGETAAEPKKEEAPAPEEPISAPVETAAEAATETAVFDASKPDKAQRERERREAREARKKQDAVKEEKGAGALKKLAQAKERVEDKPVPEAAALDGEDAAVAAEMIIADDGAAPDKASFKHKRADFRSKAKIVELPAEFADLAAAHTHSIAGGKGRRPSRGGSRSRRPGRRRGQATVQRERDPNAVSQVSAGMNIRDVSNAMGIKLSDIMSFFMKNGQLVKVNDSLGEEEISLLAAEFNINFEWKAERNLEEELDEEVEAEETADETQNLIPRPPIITFLGHVDHGKTSLLDKIRQTRVAAHEAGGITQHIGAYCIEKQGHTITFLDTPGHEAFTAMRARGANLTDIAVLVVAADDGVMPQTEEAVSHARNAEVPIVVAINKCDLPGANPDRVRQELANKLNLMPEEWGGAVGMVEVSAVTGQGIDKLLERILLEAEMLELKANPTRKAIGHVIEAKVSENQGVVTTVLVQDGTMRRGDVLLCSAGYGKVKLMFDEHGRPVDAVTPGRPARISGLNAVPDVGDRVYVLDDLLKARAIAEEREHTARSKALSRRAHVTLENLQSHLAEGEVQELKVVLKADVMGSLEVLQKTLSDISTDEVRIRIIHSGVGAINQADVILADASDAVIVGFHVIADQSSRLQASSHGVQIKIYHIIYRLIEDMKAALEGMLAPEEREVVQGHVEVRQVFKASKLGNIAGCRVSDGLVTRTSRVRIIRDGIVIYDGKIESLKRMKDDAREVRAGFECGIIIANYGDVKEGDTLEAYAIEEVARKLD